MHDLLAASK